MDPSGSVARRVAKYEPGKIELDDAANPIATEPESLTAIEGKNVNVLAPRSSPPAFPCCTRLGDETDVVSS